MRSQFEIFDSGKNIAPKQPKTTPKHAESTKQPKTTPKPGNSSTPRAPPRTPLKANPRGPGSGGSHLTLPPVVRTLGYPPVRLRGGSHLTLTPRTAWRGWQRKVRTTPKNLFFAAKFCIQKKLGGVNVRCEPIWPTFFLMVRTLRSHPPIILDAKFCCKKTQFLM